VDDVQNSKAFSYFPPTPFEKYEFKFMPSEQSGLGDHHHSWRINYSKSIVHLNHGIKSIQIFAKGVSISS
jgi:hypothetical protein